MYDNPSVSYRQLIVATQKKESKQSEAKEVRSKATEVETGEGNNVLAALTKQVAYLIAALDTKNTSSGNQRNKEGQQNSEWSREPGTKQ